MDDATSSTGADTLVGEMDRPSDKVRVLMDGPVATVIIDNQTARNALSLSMWAGIRDAFQTLAQKPEIRVIVLRGAGDVAFAAGADISEFPELRLTAPDATRYNAVLGDALRAVADSPIPTIAALRGFTVGGGCELASACDLRIAGDDLKIGIPIGRLGVILGPTETRLLVRHVGVNGLKRILFSGELFDAVEARHIGLVDEVVPSDRLWERVAALSARIVTSSSTTIRAAKAITDLVGNLNEHGTETIHRFMNEAYGGEQLREGVAAFLEKREPDFSGDAK